MRDLPTARWFVLSALLAAEVVLLSARFDFWDVAGAGTFGGRLVAWLPYVFRAVVAAAVSTCLVGGSTFLAALHGRSERLRTDRRALAALAAHLAALAGFTALTWRVTETAAVSTPLGGVWIGAWLVAGTAAGLSWAMSALPPDVWVMLFLRGRVACLQGAILGGLVVASASGYTFLWGVLGVSTIRGVRAMLSVLPAEVVYSPENLSVGTRAFFVEVGDGCSGVEGLAIIWCFLTAYLWLFRRDLRFPRVLCLVPVGTALMCVANVARITALIAIGTWVSPRVAMGGFHSQAGWLAVNMVALGLVLASTRLGWFRAGPPGGGEVETAACSNPAVPLLMPELLLLATAMLTAVWTYGEFDALYPVRVSIAGAALFWYRRDYAGLGWGWSWWAVGLGVGVFALWMAMESLAGGPTAAVTPGVAVTDPSGLPGGWAAVWLVFRVFGSVVTVPFAEELAFRCYLPRRLVSPDVDDVSARGLTWPPLLFTSVLFGLMHSRWMAGTMAGLLYGLAYRRHGRLGDAVLAHATTNALIAAYVLSSGAWSLWG